jgi:hypothetical protein
MMKTCPLYFFLSFLFFLFFLQGPKKLCLVSRQTKQHDCFTQPLYTQICFITQQIDGNLLVNCKVLRMNFWVSSDPFERTQSKISRLY